MRTRLGVYTIATMFILILVAEHRTLHAASGEQGMPIVRSAEITGQIQLAKAKLEFLHQIRAKLAQARTDQRFQDEIRAIPSGQRMSAFVQAMEKFAQDFEGKNAFKEVRARVSGIEASGGQISGLVMVAGGLVTSGISVYAFDEKGFMMGGADVQSNGEYMIDNLPAGQYYVATRSEFVDEFYNDVPLDNFRNWRAADLVTVAENGLTLNIDFDLLEGANISGTVFLEDGTIPLSSTLVTMTVFDADEPIPVAVRSVVTDVAGLYHFNLPYTGTFKMQASAFGFKSEFYDNKSDFGSADVVSVASLSDEVTDISYSLMMGSDNPADEGSVVRGTVSGPTMPLALAFVFAFDVADTSVAAFGLSDFSGNYELTGLDAGTYIFYANSFTGFLLPPALRGEYFDNAPTADLAVPLVLAGTDTAENIDFTLDTGGAISGTVTTVPGTGLEDLLVVAVKLDPVGLNGFFFDSIDFGLAFSGPGGAYTVSGLSAGDYVLRTVSLIGSDLGPGPSAGLVIDEYFDGVQDLFAVEQATKVAVTPPDTTTGIDFQLEFAGSISGHFLEVDGTTPIQGTGAVIAFDAATDYPELALTTFDTTDGSYTVGPLRTADYKLLAVVGVDLLNASEPEALAQTLKVIDTVLQQNGSSDDIIYLPQFYNLKETLAAADPVSVTAAAVTDGIDFTMIRAGSIMGRVNLSADFPVGADSLGLTSVIAYDAASGEVRGRAGVSFAGGYAVYGLPPGQYKVQAFTGANEYAATYHGGGTSFADANATPVAVEAGQTSDADILLANGLGLIGGTVTDAHDVPLNGVLLFAYDATGHAVSAGISGLPESDLLPGQYFIPGLPAGTYHVRTFALNQIFLGLQASSVLPGGGGQPLDIILGLLNNADDLGSFLNVRLFTDEWFDDQAIAVDVNSFDLFTLFFNLLASGDAQILFPFFDQAPTAASSVTVTSPGLTSGIDFALQSFGAANPTSVETPSEDVLPTRFSLEQNHPNPFNPGTTVQFRLPETTEISLEIYNMLGQRIRTLFQGVQQAGTHSAQWDGRNDANVTVAGGVYFLRLHSDSEVRTRRMLLLK